MCSPGQILSLLGADRACMCPGPRLCRCVRTPPCLRGQSCLRGQRYQPVATEAPAQEELGGAESSPMSGGDPRQAQLEVRHAAPPLGALRSRAAAVAAAKASTEQELGSSMPRSRSLPPARIILDRLLDKYTAPSESEDQDEDTEEDTEKTKGHSAPSGAQPPSVAVDAPLATPPPGGDSLASLGSRPARSASRRRSRRGTPATSRQRLRRSRRGSAERSPSRGVVPRRTGARGRQLGAEGGSAGGAQGVGPHDPSLGLASAVGAAANFGSWDWPLSRLEKKARVLMIDRQEMMIDREELVQRLQSREELVKRLSKTGA